jgi:hypothetical protein
MKFVLRKASAHERRRAALERRLDRLLRQHPLRSLVSDETLKRELSIERVISASLGEEPEVIRGEQRWHCCFHRYRLRRGDSNPSLWARDDYRGTGFGRFGCNPCGLSGDVIDFVKWYRELPWSVAVNYLTRHREEFRR